ncbi:SDR family oxidoreductase [Flavobacterium fluviale]|uniref:Short-chain dehydrogenase n=1 Tax=Flavobacterium fluviale TaxID=2249356 RepID=A0A344LWS0_9FLAO|nr:SDR family oxidoreductase [Flavobacterium fluviale]AXB58362.1 short-chain dehydrogenase [Flavobacterium fluviale]
MNFSNKNVLITGGTTGIGFAAASEFIKADANVWITGRTASNLEKAAAEIRSSKLKTIVCDTSKLSELSLLEESFSKNKDKIDVLFLNAGIGVFAPIGLITEEDFDAQFNTNVKGHFFTLQKLLPHLADGASVIFTSSTVATASNIATAVYSATKAALSKIAQIAANELAGRKIRVNIISPGPIATPGLDSVLSTDAKEIMANAVALQRLGNPDEIAKTVLFLASDGASFITGTEIIADGGYLNYSLR